MDNFYRSTCDKIKECIDKFLMSKEETERYLEDQQGIQRQDTNTAWILLERMDPDLFASYYPRIHERNARTRERVSAGSPRERASAILGDQEQQALLPDLNVPAASPQEANAVGTSRADSNDIEKQNVQTSQQQQQPVIPNDFWQQLLSTLGQIQSTNTRNLNTLGQIQSNTHQMVKLLTDGHVFGPHPSATGSLKRKRVGENEERGENEEGEKLQENEKGGNEEAEKQITEKEEGNDEEAEKPQEKEEGDNEELQKKEEGDNEELQKNERGDTDN